MLFHHSEVAIDRTKKPSILLMEDDAPLLQALLDAFTNANFEVFYFTDGESGLKGALEHHPDIILLDIIMPNMTGEKVLDNLRKDEWGKKVPVIVLSNIEPEGYLVRSIYGNDVTDYLLKANTAIDVIIKKVKKKLHVK